MANTLSKEEIREKHLRLNGLSVNKSAIGKSIQKAAFDAMDEFAKQEAIAFAEWIGKNDYIFYGGEDSTWYHSDDRKRKNPLTTELLFIQSKQQ